MTDEHKFQIGDILYNSIRDEHLLIMEVITDEEPIEDDYGYPSGDTETVWNYKLKVLEDDTVIYRRCGMADSRYVKVA